jgi:Domain of unknown function (DUF4262)
MDEHERKALSDIEQYGCHVIHVLGEDDFPPFTYSVGIQKSAVAPELVVIGLKRPIAHFIINEYNRRVRAGERFVDGQIAGGFVQGFDCLLREVDRVHYRDYFGWNRWLYDGDLFEVLQLVYPTTEGIWPWQAGASDWFRKWQTILAPHPAH